MSFIEQERALFDLLFNTELREEFLAKRTAALSSYALSPQELADFAVIRPDALAIDANMRTSMILSQLTRSYPMSMSLLSSLSSGLDSAKTWVNSALMQQAPKQRPLIFGQSMATWLKHHSFSSSAEEKLMLNIQEAELSMAWTAANTIEPTAPIRHSLPQSWPQQPIRMAENISAALLPLPYTELKQKLCTATDSQLYRQLNKQATSPAVIDELLAQKDRHLLVTLACLESGVCDPVTHHRSLVLNEGFAPLFQHINGHNSVVEILMQLTQAGANNNIVHSVKAGFEQLLLQGMLKLQ